MQRAAHITGIATAVAERVVTNEELVRDVPGLDDEWLQKTGTVARRWSAPQEDLYDLACAASLRALELAGVSPDQVGMLILASASFAEKPLSPTGVVKLQQRLGMTNGFSTFLHETCCGSLLALELACNTIMAGSAEHVLVVASDTYSKYFNREHPLLARICVPFGDGAAALVLSNRPELGPGRIVSHFRSSADFQPGVGLIPSGDGSGLTLSLASYPPEYRGQPQTPDEAIDTLKQITVTWITEAIQTVLQQAKLEVSDVAFFALHQPLRMYLEAWKKNVGIPEDKILDTLCEYGNVLGVSPLLNLERGYQTGKLRRGDKVVLASIGAGTTWGATIWHWQLDGQPRADGTPKK